MMYKYLILIFIILSSCTLPDYNYNDGKEIDYNSTVTINNSISEINVEYIDKYDTIKIWLLNDSDVLIYEIHYTINGEDIFIHDMVVPNEIIGLYNYKYSKETNIICEIIGIKYYEF